MTFQITRDEHDRVGGFNPNSLGAEVAVRRGLASARPAASKKSADLFFYATDTGELSYCNGVTWVVLAPGLAAMLTFSGTVTIAAGATLNPVLLATAGYDAGSALDATNHGIKLGSAGLYLVSTKLTSSSASTVAGHANAVATGLAAATVLSFGFASGSPATVESQALRLVTSSGQTLKLSVTNDGAANLVVTYAELAAVRLG